MERLHAVLSQLEAGHDNLMAACAIQDVKFQFTLTTSKLQQIQVHFLHEMLLGLRDTNSGTMKMLPSYVQKRDTNVSGEFCALDLGGTNFRVLKLVLDKGKVAQNIAKQFTIPKEHMQGSSKELFGFIAASVASVMDRYSTAALGFTFSFPVLQLRIDAGQLIRWTKGFTTKGVEGEDVIQLLQQALTEQGLKLKIAALCNDTVGTLITEYFNDNKAAMGVILGTGANACYWEKIKHIPKFLQEVGAVNYGQDEEMVVNMECGNFDSYEAPKCLPVTAFDRAVDLNSPNPGAQLYEKMLSGMYLGELCRLVAVYLHQKGAFPAIEGLHHTDGFSTAQMSLCISDTTPQLDVIHQMLKDKYSAPFTTVQDRTLLQQTCTLVAVRSARLAAACIATVVVKMGVYKQCTVAIDGSVFEKVPGYKKWMVAALDELFEGHPHNIKLVLTKEGSGVGAGLIAALAHKL